MNDYEWELTLSPNIGEKELRKLIVNRKQRSSIYAEKDTDKVFTIKGMSFTQSDIIAELLLCYYECLTCHAMVDNRIFKQHNINCEQKCYEKYRTYWRSETKSDYYRRLNPKNRIWIQDLTHYVI